jgi:hypothetical protein
MRYQHPADFNRNSTVFSIAAMGLDMWRLRNDFFGRSGRARGPVQEAAGQHSFGFGSLRSIVSEMTTSIFGQKRSARKISTNLVIGLVVLVLGFGYIYFLKVQDANAVADLTQLRHEDPVRYLENVRHQQGFSTYLTTLQQNDGYEHFKRDVPPFLLGRWALFDQPQKVGYEYIAEDCSDYVAIEDGAIKLRGGKDAAYPAKYRISRSTVEADIGAGKAMPITLVSYGMDLHHIVVTLPGEQKPRYGYICK